MVQGNGPGETVNPTEVLSSVPGFSGVEILRELPGGPASNSWLARTASGDCVLRIDTPTAALLGLDRGAEVTVLRSVGVAGIGPEPLHTDPEQGILVTRFVDGRAWTPEDLRDTARLARLGVLLRRLHAMRPVGPLFSPRAAMSRYAEISGAPEALEIAGEGEILLRRLSAGQQRRCLCHNDPASHNILDGTALMLLDWEYAGVGDPLFDLAVVMQHHGLDEALCEQLLLSHEENPDGATILRLRRHRAFYDRLLALWLLAVQAIGPPGLSKAQSGQLAEALDRIGAAPLV